MTVERGIGEARDQFPVGMRVLAVDDDPTCLLLLETLLRRCQYHVTTTNQAITALKMLRENKDKFDLVISDVHMPDMDGFKLLELVGLEMDLPVIMLSANGDPKLVMKGITHGACDYLLKPIRIEELKNIWQHVIRRKKFDCKDRNNFEKSHHGSNEPSADQKLNKKRKDQNEDDDEDHDEDENENDDPTTQKKPRVVWSVDLHRKFVGAVNQLGIEKAVPKKILDLMNVDKLTRENVASHLQKYRLYLKRISTVANQQANMVAALSGTDTSYLQMSSVNGLGFHNFNGSGQFHNTAFRSLPPGGMLGRLNSPASLSTCGLPSTGLMANNQSQFQPFVHPESNGKILDGMPMPLEFDRIHTNKVATCNRELPADISDTTAFSVSSSFPDTKMIVGSSNNSFLGVSNKALMLEGRHRGLQDGQKRSPVVVTSLDNGFSSQFVDHGRLNDSWSSAVQSTGIRSNSFILSDSYKQGSLCPNNLKDGMSTMALQSGNEPSDVSSIIPTLPIHLQDCKPDSECHVNSINSGAGQMINNALQSWDEHRQDALYHPNGSLNSAIHGIRNPVGRCLDTHDTVFQSTSSFGSTGQSNFADASLMKHGAFEDSAMETLVRSNEGRRIGQQKQQGSYACSNFGSLEDLVSGMVKQESDMAKLTEGDFGCGVFFTRKCM